MRITAADVPSSDRPHPRSGLDGKFSLQYTTAAALLDGQVGLASFTDERLARADMQALLGKIEVRLSRDIPSIYTAGRYLDLEVTLADGKIVRTRCERPRGSWGAAPITTRSIIAKARDCLADSISRRMRSRRASPHAARSTAWMRRRCGALLQSRQHRNERDVVDR